MRTARHIFILLLVVVTDLQAQSVIRGSVRDNSDSTPVSYAVIFLPDVSMGTSCDSSGHFELVNVPGTVQKIIVTRVGYEPVSAIIPTDGTNTVIYLHKGGAELDPVIIIGTQTDLKENSVSTVHSIDQHSMRSNGAMSISDGVARLPGVTQLTTGAGISKPVIRGLYGNRIQSVVMGMRFDNQQWQDEHGLGLQDIGVSEVEVIKGPLALVYGSEAMGGVLNILEEQPAPAHSITGDVSFRAFSNTIGGALDAGVKGNNGKIFWRLRTGSESHADYKDGNGNVVWNSRFDGHVAKGSIGWNRNHWSSVNSYLFSKSDFGFIMDTGNVVTDNRFARKFNNPHHTVYINMFTSQNSFFAGKNIFRVNVGGHLNRRMEDEGGNGVSLDMQLITAFLHAQFQHPMGKQWSLLSGVQSQYQVNTNLGWRVIVPDAQLAETGAYGYVHYENASGNDRHFVFEGGLRFDLRYLHTDKTGSFAPDAFDVPTVSELYHVINGSAGISVPFLRWFTFKANATSGYRTPNLAELQSNGVHEGTLRYEVGNPDMKIEQDLCGDLGIEFRKPALSFSVAGFYNDFLNYIYLTPTNEDWYGFRVYRFIQQDAVLQGLEFSMEITPVNMKWLDVTINYSNTRAQTEQGNYLPFIPADRLDGEFHFEIADKGKWSGMYLRAGGQYYFPQNRPAQFETSTPDYGLIDAGAGVSRKLKNGNEMQADVGCNNLLNKVYFDHLSRFKEFGIYNIGRNITFNFKYNW